MRSATSSLDFTLIFLGLFALVQSQTCDKGTKCRDVACATPECTDCPNGKYQEIDGFTGTLCKYCLAGTEYVDKLTACKTCDAGRYQSANTGSASCQVWKVCGSGEKVSVEPTRSLDRACENCDLGMYQNTNNYVETECNYCPAGRTFQNRETCSICTNGKYQLADELVTTGDCKTCVKGKHWTARDTACGICAAGTYQNSNDPGMDACKECDAGRYLIDDSVDAANHVAEADCLFCAAGTSPKTKTELCVSILI